MTLICSLMLGVQLGDLKAGSWHHLKVGLGLQDPLPVWLPHVTGRLVALHQFAIGPPSGFPQSELKAEVAESEYLASEVEHHHFCHVLLIVQMSSDAVCVSGVPHKG